MERRDVVLLGSLWKETRQGRDRDTREYIHWRLLKQVGTTGGDEKTYMYLGKNSNN